MLSASVHQGNVLLDRLFACWLGGYAITSLYYSERIIYLPIGVFAVALSTACLPEFSKIVARNDQQEIIKASLYAMRHILYLMLPCSLLFIMLSKPIVSLIFQRGNFDNESVTTTSSTLLFYALGIPAFAIVKILRANYFSRNDTWTPCVVSSFCLILNVALNILFIGPLQHRGLALATTISGYCNIVLLSFLIMRTTPVEHEEIKTFCIAILRMGLALFVSAIFLDYAIKKTALALGSTLLFDKLYGFFVPAFIGVIVYSILSILLGSKEPYEWIASWKAKRQKI